MTTPIDWRSILYRVIDREDDIGFRDDDYSKEELVAISKLLQEVHDNELMVDRNGRTFRRGDAPT